MAENTTTAKITVDISELKRNITEANRQIRLANAEFKNASTGMKNWENTTNGVSAKVNSLNKVLENQNKVLASYEKQLEIVKKEYGEDSKEADNLRIRIENQQSAINKTTQDLEKYEKELQRLKKEESTAFQTGEKLKDIGGKMENVGSTLSKTLTAGIVALGVASLKAFQEVDKGLDIVTTKTGASGQALQDMQNIAKDIATTIPVSFEQAGSAVGEVNTRFGVTGKQLEDLSTQFLKFAQLNNTDVSTSIDLVQKSLATFGLGAEDAGAMLDTLNKVGQDTGISVDKLAQSMVTNGSALKEMGFNASQSAVFLGKLEKTGVDSSQAMTGLKMALKNATQEGKPLNVALQEMQERIQNAGSDTEAMSIAMELFGNKAGASLGKAIKDGTLNLMDLSDTTVQLTDNLGNVNNTFDSTQDGMDKMRVAWNAVKLAGYELGSAIGTTLAPMLEKLANVIVDVAKGFANLDPSTKTLIVTLGAVAAAIGPILVGGGKLIVGIGQLMQTLPTLMASIASVNATMLASPITWIVGAIVAVTAATVAYVSALDSQAEAEYGLSEAQKENIDNIHSMSEAYKSMNDARNQSNSAINNEFDYIKSLKNEYNGLIDNNGQIKAGYEDRANFIINELARALGVEIEQIRAQIDANGQLGASIDQVIEKKRAEALLNANQEAYNQAIAKRSEAFNNLVKAQNDAYEAQAKWANIQREVNEVQNTYNELLATQGTRAANLYMASQYEIIANGNKAKESYELTQLGLIEAKEAYEGYNQTIQNYEGLSSAIISGDADKVNQAMQNMTYNFKTAETADRQSLEQQVRDMKTNYDNMQKAINEKSPYVTQEMVNQSKNMVDKAQAELDKLPPIATQDGTQSGENFANGIGSQAGNAYTQASNVETNALWGIGSSTGSFGDSGSEAGGSYAWGVATRQGDAYNSGQGVGSNAVQGSRDGSSGSFDSGSFFGEGFINGISSWLLRAFGGGMALAQEALAGLRKGQQEGSPSKLTEQSGEYFAEGYEIGIREQMKYVVKSATDLAKEAYIALRDSNFNFYQLGVQDGRDYVNGLKESLEEAKRVAREAKESVNEAIGGSSSSSRSSSSSSSSRSGTSSKSKSSGEVIVSNYYLTQNNSSPKALSTIDIYRNTQNQFSLLKGLK